MNIKYKIVFTDDFIITCKDVDVTFTDNGILLKAFQKHDIFFVPYGAIKYMREMSYGK